jgi:hypothetical protein
MRVTDVHTLNTALGSLIEQEVVRVLNSLRPLWDPDGRYAAHGFLRQAQAFPDVLLACRRDDGTLDVSFGIELKSWYLLSEEQEPSLRMLVTPRACHPADLVVVVPWYLSAVVSGTPRITTPWVELARYVAEYRNYYWEVLRGGSVLPEKRRVISPEGDVPFHPPARDRFNDRAAHDPGGNFGRIARTGLLDAYVHRMLEEEILGVPCWLWIRFFRLVSGAPTPEVVARVFADLRKKLPEPQLSDQEWAEAVIAAIRREFGIEPAIPEAEGDDRMQRRGESRIGHDCRVSKGPSGRRLSGRN